MSDCIEYDGARTSGGYGNKWDPKTKRYRPVHRMVYEEAHGPVPDELDVMHKCDNRACYRLDHLTVGTRSDNLRDMTIKGRNPKARLSLDDVREIRRLLADGVRQREIAKGFGVTPEADSAIKRRVSYAWLDEEAA